MKDPRNNSYTKYNTLELLLTTLLANLMTIKTGTDSTEIFGNDQIIDNFKKIVKNQNLSDLLRYDTINDFLENLKFVELENIKTKMIKALSINPNSSYKTNI